MKRNLLGGDNDDFVDL